MRAAIVGCGEIARVHLGALRNLTDVELVGVCDRDVWRARDLAQMSDGATPYTDLGAMLAEQRPDTLHVLTPPASHAALAIQGMEAGCHVLVEKPMALSLQEADRMIAAAEANEVTLTPNHNYLFKPSIQKALRLVGAGEIGDVVYVNGYYGLAGEGSAYAGRGGRSHWAYGLPGGAFTNFLPHVIYLLQAFLPDVADVQGVALAPGGGREGQPTELAVTLQGEGGCGVLVVSMRARPYAKYVDVYGTQGTVHADLVREIATVHRARALPRMVDKVTYSIEDGAQTLAGTVGNVAGVALGRAHGYQDLHGLVAAFYGALQAGTAPPVSAEEGRRMVGVLEAIRAHSPEPLQRAPAARPQVVHAQVAEPQPRTAAERTLAEEGLPGKALVTGATGFLGFRLVEALWRSGVDVVALVRDPSRMAPSLGEWATIARGDLRDPAAIAAAMDGVGTVFHTAAITTNRARWQAHHETNVLGTRAVLDAAAEAGAQHVIHVSSVIVYGLHPDANGSAVDESAQYAEPDQWAHYMRSKRDADVLAMDYVREQGLPVTVARLGILYGPGGGFGGTGGLTQLGSARLVMGSGGNLLPFTFVDNAIDALLLLALHPECAGEAYNVVDEPQVSVREALRILRAVRGERGIVVPLPATVFRLGARFLEGRQGRDGADLPPPLTRYVVDSARRNVRYATDKIRRDVGWQPEVSLEEGLRRTVAAGV